MKTIKNITLAICSLDAPTHNNDTATKLEKLGHALAVAATRKRGDDYRTALPYAILQFAGSEAVAWPHVTGQEPQNTLAQQLYGILDIERGTAQRVACGMSSAIDARGRCWY